MRKQLKSFFYISEYKEYLLLLSKRHWKIFQAITELTRYKLNCQFFMMDMLILYYKILSVCVSVCEYVGPE